MAQIKIAGSAMVLTSGVKLEDIQLLEKYNPDALKLYRTDEDGKKECVFTVKTAACGGIGPRAAIFDAASLDGNGLATFTTDVPVGVTPENLKEKVADLIGNGVILLNEVEAQIPAAVEAVKANQASVMESIIVG